jgi:hypothetical protein
MQTLYLAILYIGGKYETWLFPYPDDADDAPGYYFTNKLNPPGPCFLFVAFYNLVDSMKKGFVPEGARNTLITQCAWCGKVKIHTPEGVEWRELPDDVIAPLLGKSVTHGICPDCAAGYKVPSTKLHDEVSST